MASKSQKTFFAIVNLYTNMAALMSHEPRIAEASYGVMFNMLKPLTNAHADCF